MIGKIELTKDIFLLYNNVSRSKYMFNKKFHSYTQIFKSCNISNIIFIQ